jgi:phytoene/squalene synthetase
LANFWQDAGVDVEKGRLYFPLEDLERFAVAVEDLRRAQITPQMRQLMSFEVGRARSLLLEGRRLAELVDRRLSCEVMLFAGGGLAILRKIESVDFDVFTRRPVLTRWEKASLVLGAAAGLHRQREGSR